MIVVINMFLTYINHKHDWVLWESLLSEVLVNTIYIHICILISQRSNSWQLAQQFIQLPNLNRISLCDIAWHHLQQFSPDLFNDQVIHLRTMWKDNRLAAVKSSAIGVGLSNVLMMRQRSHAVPWPVTDTSANLQTAK